MKLFFDTEFTGLTKDTTLISIGVVDEAGETFYGECTDYSKDQVSPWIQENVINNLIFDGDPCIKETGTDSVYMRGRSDVVGEELLKWIAKRGNVQFVSDVCHYDFMLLVDLISPSGSALDLPSNISPVCHDINQDIAKYLNISDRDAFDVNREDIVKNYLGISNVGAKHRSSHDARMIRIIYKAISTND